MAFPLYRPADLLVHLAHSTARGLSPRSREAAEPAGFIATIPRSKAPFGRESLQQRLREELAEPSETCDDEVLVGR